MTILIIKGSMVEGPVLVLAKVNREHIGDYVCLADNGVTPPAQKTLSLEVHCKFTNILLFAVIYLSKVSMQKELF